MPTYKSKSRQPTNAAELVANEIKSFVRDSPLNHLPTTDNDLIYSEPLVQYADGDDPIFNEYETIIDPAHLTPRKVLTQAYDKNPEEIPARLSVISWILPITEKTRISNRTETRVPSRLWSHTRWYGEMLNGKLREYLVTLLNDMGYLATAPFSQPYFKTFSNEKGPYSNWSERHIAYAAGLGTFSLSDGFITEGGIAIRCGAVVTDLVLPKSPRVAEGPYSNCLHYAGVNCRACIKRCPADAISKAGHDKIKCQQYLQKIGYSRESYASGYDNEKSIAGCGLCQTKVPCESENPVKRMKKERI